MSAFGHVLGSVGPNGSIDRVLNAVVAAPGLRAQISSASAHRQDARHHKARSRVGQISNAHVMHTCLGIGRGIFGAREPPDPNIQADILGRGFSPTRNVVPGDISKDQPVCGDSSPDISGRHSRRSPISVHAHAPYIRSSRVPSLLPAAALPLLSLPSLLVLHAFLLLRLVHPACLWFAA